MWKNIGFESRILLVLMVSLVCVFALSVNMYDEIENEAEKGRFAPFVSGVRNFVDENDAVAVFLGVRENESDIPVLTATESMDVFEKANAYIERYNNIYETFK